MIAAVACGTAADPDSEAPAEQPRFERIPVPTAAPTATPEPEVVATEVVEEEADGETAAAESIGQYIGAHSLLNRGDYVQAERRFVTVTKIEPNFARGWAGLGDARLLKGDAEGAEEAFNQAIALKPDLAPAYASRAASRILLGDNDGAMQDARMSIGLDPTDPNPWIIVGRLGSDRNDFVEAQAAFDTAVLLAPGEGGAYFWRGRFLARAGQIGFALADLDRAIEYAPALSGAYLEKGLLLARTGDIDGARSLIEEARDRAEDPKNPTVLEQAKQLLEQLGEADSPTGGATGG